MTNVLQNWTYYDDEMHQDLETDKDPTSSYRSTLLKLVPSCLEEIQASFDSCRSQLSYAS